MKKFLAVISAIVIITMCGCSINHREVPTVVTTTATADSIIEFDANKYPDYVALSDSKVTNDKDVNAGTIEYSQLDNLGRSGRAVGRITNKMVSDSAGWRAKFAPDVDKKLSGWGHNEKVNIDLGSKSYSGYFWNRSHLISDSLGGYNHHDNTTHVENLITGTRTQNVGKNDGNGGMAYFETRTVSYINSHPNVTVWYSAEPVFVGNELICRGVNVKVLSSDGNLDMQGYVFNSANGYNINYLDGTFTKE